MYIKKGNKTSSNNIFLSTNLSYLKSFLKILGYSVACPNLANYRIINVVIHLTLTVEKFTPQKNYIKIIFLFILWVDVIQIKFLTILGNSFAYKKKMRRQKHIEWTKKKQVKKTQKEKMLQYASARASAENFIHFYFIQNSHRRSKNVTD